MKCYQIAVMEDGCEFDDLTLWVEAPSEAAVMRFVARLSPPVSRSLSVDPIEFKTWGDGLDAIIGDDGHVQQLGYGSTGTLPMLGSVNAPEITKL